MQFDCREIGNRMREARLKCGYTQKGVADAVRISESHYAHFECGERMLAIPVLIDLANYVGVSCDYLFCGKELKQVKISELAEILENSSEKQIDAILTVAKTIIKLTEE